MRAYRPLLLTCALLALTLVSDAYAQSASSLAPAAKNPTKSPSVSAPNYRLDAESGAVRFGDGQHGRRPPAGQSQISNPSGVSGGAGAETADQAEQRLPQTLRHRQRTVNKSDYRPLANPTPGVSIGRVIATPPPSGEPEQTPPAKRPMHGSFARPTTDDAATQDSKPATK